MASRAASTSNAQSWFLHRITGTFLIFMLITHFWVQHYDQQTATISHDVLSAEQIENNVLPGYTPEAEAAVEARFGETAEVTPHDVVMLRLADPVYAVLWKAFNILFLIVALHHGFYGLNNVMSDYIRNPMARKTAKVLSWSLALVLFVVGTYSVLVAGW